LIQITNEKEVVMLRSYPRTPGWRRALPALLAFALVLALVPTSAHAVPAFARKYRTSCQTCHTVFPKLNPFGEAFRFNGYRMPGETEEQVKQEPVSLGAPAYAQMWPHAVYPGDLPGNAPIALNVKMANLYESSREDEGTSIIHNDFQMPQEVNLFAAGTMGEKFSFFSELTYGQNPDGSSEVEIEHAQIHVNSPCGPEHAINLKIGKFAPDLEDGFQEMWLMTDNGVDSLFTYDPIGIHGGTGVSEEPAGISLPDSVQGIELYGVLHHRFFYTLGLTNGLGSPDGSTFDGNSTKDVYARIGYKCGGMGLDGDTTGEEIPANNWQEKSFRIDVLGYRGNGEGIGFEVDDEDGNTLLVEDRTFDRYGLFVSWYWGNLNVFGVALRGSDDLSVTDPETSLVTTSSPTFDTFFVQADYVIVPPFQVSLRYEVLNPADEASPSVRFFNANFTYLIRANVKGMLEYHRDLEDSQNYALAAVLRFAI